MDLDRRIAIGKRVLFTLWAVQGLIFLGLLINFIAEN